MIFCGTKKLTSRFFLRRFSGLAIFYSGFSIIEKWRFGKTFWGLFSVKNSYLVLASNFFYDKIEEMVEKIKKRIIYNF